MENGYIRFPGHRDVIPEADAKSSKNWPQDDKTSYNQLRSQPRNQ